MFILSECIGSIYNVLLMGLFIRGFFQEREGLNHFYYHAFQVLFCMVLTGFSIFPDFVLPRIACSLLGFFLDVFLFYKSGVLQAFFSSLLFYALVSVIDMFSMGFLHLIGVSTGQMMISSPSRLIFIINSNLLYTLFFLLLISCSKKEEKAFSIKSVLPLIPCELASIFMCYIILIQSIHSKLPVWTFLYLIILLYLNITVILYSESIQRSTFRQKQHELSEQQFHIQEAYYQKLLESQQETRAMWHDIKKYILAMNDALSSDVSSSVAQGIVNQAQHTLDSITQTVSTGNAQIDMILTYYLTAAKEKDISVEMDISISPQIRFSPVDLYIIIGNTFDNAIESCLSFPSNFRKITIKLREINNMLFYSIKNPFSNEKHYLNDQHCHGYGLKNVRRCIVKYNGTMTISKDSFFTCTIRLNLPDSSTPSAV